MKFKFFYPREDKEVFSIIMSDDEGREELKKSLADKLDVNFLGLMFLGGGHDQGV